MSGNLLPTTVSIWFWQSSLVVNNWLYIHGGEIWGRWGGQNSNATMVTNYQTMALDLKTSWNTSYITAVKSNFTNVNPSRRPEMWYDSNADTVYSFGGWQYGPTNGEPETSVPVNLWGFTPSSNGVVTWNQQTYLGSPLISNLAGASSASSTKAHYSLGGLVQYVDDSNRYQKIALQEALSYNFTTKTFANVSSPALEPRLAYGRAEFIPFYGQQGVVLYFGGGTPPTRAESYSVLAGLDSIIVFDIATGNYYKQPASNAPLARYGFCSVGASARDKSSYEIFIYGGSTGFYPTAQQRTQLAQVYILSLPSFNWFLAPNSTQTWRSEHTCQNIGNRHMISMGGDLNQVVNNESFPGQSDPWPNGMGIFDMVDLVWTGKYNSSAAAYTPPRLVASYYNSTTRYPKSWADTALATIFSNSTSGNAASGNNSTSSGDTSGHSETAKSPNTGAIAGGVVGGVAAIVLISLLTWWLRRRKSAKSDYIVPPEQAAELSNQERKIQELHGEQPQAKELPSQAEPAELPVQYDQISSQDPWGQHRSVH